MALLFRLSFLTPICKALISLQTDFSNPATCIIDHAIWMRFFSQLRPLVLTYNRMWIMCSKFHFQIYIVLVELNDLRNLGFAFYLDLFPRNCPTVQNCPKKKKNLYLIKLVSKWKRAIRKGHTSFLVFDFWDLTSVPIDSI